MGTLFRQTYPTLILSDKISRWILGVTRRVVGIIHTYIYARQQIMHIKKTLELFIYMLRKLRTLPQNNTMHSWD